MTAQAGTLGDLAADLSAASLSLARRFARGATMWCAAPAWPHHARHIAVEFVHPVIVGKRALPAVMLSSGDLVATLRPSVRSGDVLIAIAPAGEPSVADAVRRCKAWGVETIWIGQGPRPEPGSADHVLWLPEPDPYAAHDGRFILLYHLLWELTHVCFEHPGLLDADEACTTTTCITCADEGRLGEVVTLRDEAALVRTAEGEEMVDIALVGPVQEHDLLLVHAGSAITVVGP